MSQKTYPDRKSLNLYKSEHVAAFEDALAQAEKAFEGDDPSKTEKIAHIAESYVARSKFDRLADDMRIKEARKVVAQDHGMDASDISLAELLKITAGAYCGYQQTSDWKPENAESGGFKETVEDTA